MPWPTISTYLWTTSAGGRTIPPSPLPPEEGRTDERTHKKDQHIAYLQARVGALEEVSRRQRRSKAVISAVAIALGMLLTALVTWDLMDPRYGFLYRIMSSIHGTGTWMNGMLKG